MVSRRVLFSQRLDLGQCWAVSGQQPEHREPSQARTSIAGFVAVPARRRQRVGAKISVQISPLVLIFASQNVIEKMTLVSAAVNCQQDRGRAETA